MRLHVPMPQMGLPQDPHTPVDIHSPAERHVHVGAPQRAAPLSHIPGQRDVVPGVHLSTARDINRPSGSGWRATVADLGVVQRQNRAGPVGDDALLRQLCV